MAIGRPKDSKGETDKVTIFHQVQDVSPIIMLLKVEGQVLTVLNLWLGDKVLDKEDKEMAVIDEEVVKM